MKKIGLAGSTALAVLVACTGSVFAQDMDAFLSRFKALVTENGTTVKWANAEEYDNDEGEASVALIDTVVTNAKGSSTIARIEMSGVSEDDDGWHVGTLTVPSFSRTDDGTTVTVNDVNLEGLVITPEGQENAYGSNVAYDVARLGDVSVANGGKQVFAMSDAYVEISPPGDGSPMEFSGSAESFTAQLDAIDDPKTKAIVAAMGYSTLTGSFEVTGSWDPDSGLFNLAQYDIAIDNAGTIGISMLLGGYTREFANANREAQAKLMADPQGNAGAGMETLDAIQKHLTFNSARIRFDDDTLTGKILAFVAKQQGSRARDVAAQAKIMVPFMAMQFGSPEIAAMVSTAAAAYLDNPQSLTIAAEPPAPIGFEKLIEGAMMEPQTLPNVLGLKITAND